MGANFENVQQFTLQRFDESDGQGHAIEHYGEREKLHLGIANLLFCAIQYELLA